MSEYIGGLRDSRTPGCHCPFCDHFLESAMAGPANPDTVPKPGDVSVCISCASVLVFTEQLTLRAPRPGEIPMTPALRRAQEAVRQLDRRKMR